MMSKLLEIDNCYDCKHCLHSDISCLNPNLGNQYRIFGRKIDNAEKMYTEIPEWCPLEDAEENKL